MRLTSEEVGDMYRAHCAKALGWTVKDCQGFSLSALEGLVRGTHPMLAYKISQFRASGNVIAILAPEEGVSG